MKLTDLSPTQCAVINLIRQHGDTSRPRIVDELCRKGPHKMPEGTVSSSMSRLEGFGFIARPASGAGWRLTPEGAALFAFEDAEFVDPPCPEPQPQDAPEPEPDADPEPDPPFLSSGLATLRALIDPLQAAFAADAPLAEPSIIDQHLAFVRAALSAPPPLPAESARVYREIIQVLPLSLVEALLPITKLVEARS